MKFERYATGAAALIGSVQAGCPFAGGGLAGSISEHFNDNGAAPSFKQMKRQFKGPFSECDEYGACKVVDMKNNNQKPMQSLQKESETCEDTQPNFKETGFKNCYQVVSMAGGCNQVKDKGYCDRTCAVCSPVFVSKFGRRSGTPYDIEQDGDELALGASFYMPKLPAVKCGEAYPVKEVVAAALGLFEKGYADVAASVRMGFHDAGDFDKWLGTGGADGRFINTGEDWYGQSRTTNKGTVCARQLLGGFKSSSLSAGDAVQICAIAAVEFTGGPKFEEFNFTPGRAPVKGVTSDGMLPNPNGSPSTLRDYYYRMGLNDMDIVVLMGAHTLGGGAGAAGSGYTNNFTPNSGKFDNTYYKQLIEFENAGDSDSSCDYWSKTPSQRGANGGCHVGPGQNLQLPTDRALVRDPTFKAIVSKFAEDQQAFFDQYTKSYKKLSELGRDISVHWCDWDEAESSSATLSESIVNALG